MKIGIVTLPLNYNYGGLLQAYALQTVLERMGNEVQFVDVPYTPHTLSPKNKFIVYSKRIIKKYLLRQKALRIRRESYFKSTYKDVCVNTDRFIDEYIHRRLTKSRDEVKVEDYDCFVVGSDQIWRAAFVPKIEEAYLDFAEDWPVKRVAYAASLGVDSWEYNDMQTSNCKNLIRRFDAISVRESTGVKLLREHLGVEAVHVLDPTLLLSREDYRLIADRNTLSIPENSMDVYLLDTDESKQSIVVGLANRFLLTPVYTNSKTEDLSLGLSLEERTQPAVEYWLDCIRKSRYVITDSFHACVFSIIFHKQFWVLGNKKRGMSRIESLLEMLRLQDRLIYKLPEALDAQAIDYAKVDKKLDELRRHSMSFLENAIGDQ